MPRYNLSIGGKKITLAETDKPISKQIGERFNASPDTRIDSGGSINSHSFNGQEITRSELRDIKEMRESGGVISQLVKIKALLNFGTGFEFNIEDEEPIEVIDGDAVTLTEWLESHFNDLETLILDVGEDALWYPYGAVELVETRAGGFSHVAPVQPWTVLPKTDSTGEIVYWEQEIQADNGRNFERFGANEIVHFPINKSSARDKTGISSVLRSKDEIEQFKRNQRAIASAIELHGFPQRHVRVGREGGAPINDNELRRVRTLFDARTTDSDTVYITGRDVDIDALEAENFEFDKVTENDMRQLTLSLGLPLEAGNVGSDGLGSGMPADVRMSILKLQIKANQRNYANMWVKDVFRPILKKYSPFDHTVNFSLSFNDPLEDMEDMANLISQVGEYMETNEARKKLDLEPKEDLEGEFGAPGDSGDEGIFDQLENKELQDVSDIDTTPPESVQEQARMALDWREETGNPNDCGTQTGWERANQLDNGESLSEDTINRMVSFFARHEHDQEPDEAKEDCSRMMWKAWGGDAGKEWAESKQEEFENARENAAGDADFSDVPEWDSHLMDMHSQIFEDSSRELLQFTASQTPEFVKERLREAVMSGAIFSDIDAVPGSEMMQLREFMTETLESDGWTIDGLSDQLMQIDGINSRDKAEVIARTETASVVNSAREAGYRERGQDDDKFYWSGSLDDRTTEACKWLIEKTNPFKGGEPVSLDRLKELIDEAPEHDPDMDDNLARPDNFVVHPQERKTFIRAP